MLAQVQVENNQKIIKQLTGTVCSDSVTVGDMHPVTSNAVAIALNGSINNIIDLVYPVGSIYWSGVANDPNVIFGGTWVQIKDKFILAKGDSDTLDATGGEASVSLTISQIPNHRHSFTPSGTISITTNPTFNGSTVTSGNESQSHTHDMQHIHSISHGHTASTSLHLGGGSNSNDKGIHYPHSGSYKGWYSNWCSTKVNDYSGWSSNAYDTSGGTRINDTGTNSRGHTHDVLCKGTVTGGSYSFSGTKDYTSYEGSSGAHNNMPPYIVKYCWQRTA